MQKPIISGIQQIGVGIPDVHAAFKWYRQNFGIDIPILDAPGTAELMLPYTGGKPHERHAILAINIQGGGGMEIWQYMSRKPQPAKFDVQLGDLGIFIAKVKSRNVQATFDEMKRKNLDLITEVVKNPIGRDHFYVRDPYGNIFEIVEGESWFKKNGRLTGGMYGCVIGVTDMEAAKTFYKNVLGYDVVVYQEEGQFTDFQQITGGNNTFERVLLRHSQERKGAFSRLLGASEIELVAVKDRTPKKIYDNRFWGDLGFIHLTFDIRGMEAMKQHCEANGHPFTVDSRKGDEVFDMGEAAGHFSYIEDPDGTLIEFVETHKVPIVKALGLNLNLANRPPEKALPNWMVKALGFGRVKD